MLGRSSLLLASGVLTLGIAGPSSAVVLGYTSSLAIQIATLPPVVLLGGGTVVVNGSGGPGHLTALTMGASPFAVTGLVVPVTDPAAFPIAGVQVTAHNGTGVFGGSTNAGFGGVMPILGAAKVCLFGPCSAAVANLVIPLSVVGAGGATTVMGAVSVTVIGGTWTTGTVAVGTLTAMGSAAPASGAGANSGMVTLVTPVFLSTNIGASAVIPAFGILSLHFVPEPGTLLLLASGVAGLAALGRRRMKRA